MASTTITEQNLQAAWNALRRREWPATLAETMQDPARASLLRGYAITLAHRKPVQRFPAPVKAATSMRAPCRAPEHHTTQPHGWVDRKRAAAGDRDD